MSHFDSQLQNCFVRDGKPEVPGLGVDVLSPGGRQDLHLGAVVPAVQDGGLRTQHEGLVSCDAGLVLLDVPRGDKFNVLVQDSEATLSERVLLLIDAAFLGLDFMEELAVGAPQVRTHVPVDVVLDHDNLSKRSPGWSPIAPRSTKQMKTTSTHHLNTCLK